jgi:hypothetical protein
MRRLSGPTFLAVLQGGIRIRPMCWQSFEVRPGASGGDVARQLQRQLDLVNAIHLPLGADVAVFRRDRSDGARFFFSGAAVELFKTLVQFYGAKPCRRPTTSRHTVRLVPERAP